ncbi:MAG: hypothetical protein LN412_04745 [Candidatus Thermoplasmatota archaeon]|nr:hypothetical protein [Candidatus Thermoplasmatota archaeon]
MTEKKPLFFRDEGALGDVLSQARGLVGESEKLVDKVRDLGESAEEYAELVEDAKYKVGIRERLGEGVEGFKNKLNELATTWKDKREEELMQKEAELQAKQDEIENQRKTLEENLARMEEEQKGTLSKEMERINQHSEEVKSELEKLNRTKEAIDNVLSESEEEIRDKTLTREEVEFLKVDYFNLVKSRLDKGLKSPITSTHHYGNWDIGQKGDMLTAAIKAGVRRKPAIRFDVRYMIPEEEEGFIYKKMGGEALEAITGYLGEEKGEDSFHAFVLVSPTGWTSNVMHRAENIFDSNTSVYLVDLMERSLVCNEKDKKTKEMEEWFSPVSLEEEVNSLREKLKAEVEEENASQFRADKVSAKYSVPRKVVIAAFKAMAADKVGEVIGKREGAKDLIFLVGGA